MSPQLIGGLGRFGTRSDLHPWRFFLGLFVLSAASYVLLVLVYGPARWLGYGPFAVQASRILLYAVYYFAGVAIGASGFKLLGPDSKLAKRWWLWLLLAPLAFVSVVAIVIAATVAKGQSVALWDIVGGTGFALSCGISSFAMMALFARFTRHRVKLLDSLADNAYGMYVVHYAFVTWAQFLLLNAPLSGVAKGFLVFGIVVILSWGTTALLRRVPGVALFLGTTSREHRHAAIAG